MAKRKEPCVGWSWDELRAWTQADLDACEDPDGREHLREVLAMIDGWARRCPDKPHRMPAAVRKAPR